MWNLLSSAVGVGDGSDFRYEMYEGRNMVHSLSLASLMASSNSEARTKVEEVQEGEGSNGSSLLFNIPDAPSVKRDVKMLFFCSSVRNSCSSFLGAHTIHYTVYALFLLLQRNTQ